jgi:hypothetical protein
MRTTKDTLPPFDQSRDAKWEGLTVTRVFHRGLPPRLVAAGHWGGEEFDWWMEADGLNAGYRESARALRNLIWQRALWLLV